jgi:Bacteriophage minor capsid protein
MFHQDVIVRLAAQNCGVANSTLFWGVRAVLPDGDGPFVTVVPTGGMSPLKVHNDNGAVRYERPSAQIVVRAKSFDVAMTRAYACREALSFANTEVNGTFYLSMCPAQEPYDIGPDDKGRARAAFNVHAVKNK